MLAVALATIIGYLFGSVPFGLLLTRAAGLGDVRKIGSGNIGATNVLRTGNKKLAALTLLLDALKGTLAVILGGWIAAWLAPLEQAEAADLITRASLAGGLAAFVGHVFPAWLGFKGGKGVATYIGVLVGAALPAALVFAVTWLLIAAVTRYSSLSSMIATAAAFFYLAATGGPIVASAAAALSALLIWTHRENIRRLAQGTESKIGAQG